jgi:hypothetical protein
MAELAEKPGTLPLLLPLYLYEPSLPHQDRKTPREAVIGKCKAQAALLIQFILSNTFKPYWYYHRAKTRALSLLCCSCLAAHAMPAFLATHIGHTWDGGSLKANAGVMAIRGTLEGRRQKTVSLASSASQRLDTVQMFQQAPQKHTVGRGQRERTREIERVSYAKRGVKCPPA